MIVIFVKNNVYGENENVIFLGCYNDMETCKQTIIKDANEYINCLSEDANEYINCLSEDENECDESYYVVFDENTKEEKKKFFVKNFELKATVKVEKIE